MPTGAGVQYGSEDSSQVRRGRDGMLVVMCWFWSSRVGRWTDLFFLLDSLQVGGATCHLLDSLTQQTDTATQLKEQLEINIDVTVRDASAVGRSNAGFLYA